MLAFVYVFLDTWQKVMNAKMVTIGARVPQEDAEFIAQLKIEGATTPSDKVRAIIAEARRRQQGSHDYQVSFDMTSSMLASVTAKTRQLEMEHSIHSEIVMRTLEWLPDMMAYVLSSNQKLVDGNAKALTSVEQGIADRVFRLMESVLQMGVTQRCPCYNKNAVMNRVEPVLDLARVIERARVSKEEESK
jgi:hypothetical protein